ARACRRGSNALLNRSDIGFEVFNSVGFGKFTRRTDFVWHMTDCNRDPYSLSQVLRTHQGCLVAERRCSNGCEEVELDKMEALAFLGGVTEQARSRPARPCTQVRFLPPPLIAGQRPTTQVSWAPAPASPREIHDVTSGCY